MTRRGVPDKGSRSKDCPPENTLSAPSSRKTRAATKELSASGSDWSNKDSSIAGNKRSIEKLLNDLEPYEVIDLAQTTKKTEATQYMGKDRENSNEPLPLMTPNTSLAHNVDDLPNLGVTGLKCSLTAIRPTRHKTAQASETKILPSKKLTNTTSTPSNHHLNKSQKQRHSSIIHKHTSKKATSPVDPSIKATTSRSPCTQIPDSKATEVDRTLTSAASTILSPFLLTFL